MKIGFTVPLLLVGVARVPSLAPLLRPVLARRATLLRSGDKAPRAMRGESGLPSASQRSVLPRVMGWQKPSGKTRCTIAASAREYFGADEANADPANCHIQDHLRPTGSSLGRDNAEIAVAAARAN